LGVENAPTERKYMRVLPTEQSESKWLFRMKCRKKKRGRLESCFCGEDTPTIRMGDERSKGFKRTFLLGCQGLGATSHLAVLTTLLNARLVTFDRKEEGTHRQHRSYGTCAGMQRKALGTNLGTIAKDNCCKAAVPSYWYLCISLYSS